MATLALSAAVKTALSELPRDRSLLTSVWRRLEDAADDPERWTEFPAPFPHSPKTRLFAFDAYDSSGRRWAFSALFVTIPDDLEAIQLAYNDAADEYPEPE